jgi:hypothetical protein
VVENVVTWRKASRSDNGGNCVEVAFGPDGRATGMVRDSKRPHDGNLAVSVDALAAFLASVKAGRFELGRLGPSGI